MTALVRPPCTVPPIIRNWWPLCVPLQYFAVPHSIIWYQRVKCSSTIPRARATCTAHTYSTVLEIPLFNFKCPKPYTAGLTLDPTWGRVAFSRRRTWNSTQESGQGALSFPQSPRGRSQNVLIPFRSWGMIFWITWPIRASGGTYKLLV